MQIDWLTVTAQIVNFLVLVWLLQHFLYGPITKAMQRREERIANRLREAEAKREAADEEARAYREKQADFEQRRKELLEQAREAAAQERRALEHEARDDVKARKRGWLEQLSAERRSFEQDLRRRSADAFYAVARRALGDLAGAELEAQIVQSFIRELGDLDDSMLEKVRSATGTDDGDVVVESRFPLDADLRRQLTRAIHERLGREVHVDYTETPGLDVGITLVAGSQQVAWTIGHYLDDLERAVDQELARVTAEFTDHEARDDEVQKDKDRKDGAERAPDPSARDEAENQAEAGR